MSVLINEQWNYQLLKKDNDYFLSVICGTAGLFEVEFKLTKDEVSDYEKNGKECVDKLVSFVRSDPEKYMSRNK